MSNILTVCKMFCPMFCLTSLKKKDWEMCSPACEAHRKRDIFSGCGIKRNKDAFCSFSRPEFRQRHVASRT